MVKKDRMAQKNTRLSLGNIKILQSVNYHVVAYIDNNFT